MTKRIVVCSLAALALSMTASAVAQPSPASANATAGSVHHQVSSNASAQAAFDRGLLDYFAYNPEAAEHEFYTASDLDPTNPMPWWGIALSDSPNLNVPATDDRDRRARFAIVSAKGLESSASPEDRMLIDAAYARFGPTIKTTPAAALLAYRDQLARIAKTYSADPNVAALHAEAALYVAALKPGNASAFAALLPMFQTYIARFPYHPGLLHFYVHAAQFANDSKAAVDAATRLASLTFPDEDSHLTHMPGHTFFDVGMYDAALDVGRRSVAMDVAQIACCHPGYYSATRYYRSHNAEFLIYAMIQTGHAADTVAVANAANDPDLLVPALVATSDWKAILALPYLKANGPVMWFARDLAIAKLGDADRAEADLAKVPAVAASQPSGYAIDRAKRSLVRAQIALDRHDDAKALVLLQTASRQAAAGDRLSGRPEMPSLYYYSPHLALADLATKMGDTAIARAALDAELRASPKSPAATQALVELNGAR